MTEDLDRTASPAGIAGPAAAPFARRPTPVRRGGRLTEERRRQIVSKAARLFLDHGYENVSIDDIVAEIGGSKRTLYARFGGKAGLFEIVIKAYCAAVDRDLEAGVDPSQAMEEQLVRIGTNFLALILDPKILELHRLMVSMGRTFPSVTQTFFEVGPKSAYGIVAGWIARQQQAGRIRAGDPDQLAAFFLDMLTGQHQLARLTTTSLPPSAETVARTVRSGVGLFLRGAVNSHLRSRRERPDPAIPPALDLSD